MLTAAEIKAGMSQFIGTGVYHRILGNVVATDGAKWLADNAGAYWLLTAIASHQVYRKVREEPFQVWRLQVSDQTAVLTCDDGNGTILAQQDIPYTDFPLSEVKLYAVVGEGLRVVILPNEY